MTILKTKYQLTTYSNSMLMLKNAIREMGGYEADEEID